MERFTNLKPPKKFIQDETAQAIKSILNIDINLDDIEERGNIIYIKTKNPSAKNEIFLKKNLILEILQKKIGNRAPKDLRF